MIVVLGSSPNALAAAARLARAGRRVVVLEPRETIGGPVATESFAPGFRADTGVTSAALDPEVVRDLGLSIPTVRRASVTLLGASPGRLVPQTLTAMPELPRAASQALELLQAIDRLPPPDMPVPGAALDDVLSRLTGLGARAMHEVLRLTFLSARDFFEGSEAAYRALLCGVAVRGLSEGPFSPGTLHGFLRHWANDDALFRTSAQGGVQRIAEGIAEVARAAGVEIRTGVRDLRVQVEDGTARGAGGLEADVVISDYDARWTFTKLVRPSELDPETNREIRAIRHRGSVARVHLALKGLPDFHGLGAEALRGTLVVTQGVASLERAWDEAKRGIPSSAPYVEVTLPTLDDPSLAPTGQHVLDAWVQYVPYGRGDRDKVAQSVIDGLTPYAPKLPELILHRHVSLPQDLEARFGLTEGHLYGGEQRLEQAFFFRGIPGTPRYQTPIAHLVLCGSAAHPGGYTGRSGWNLAGELLKG